MSVVEFQSLLNVSFKPDAFPSSPCFCHHDITVCFQMRLLADLTAQPDNLSELIYGFLPHPPPRLDRYVQDTVMYFPNPSVSALYRMQRIIRGRTTLCRRGGRAVDWRRLKCCRLHFKRRLQAGKLDACPRVAGRRLKMFTESVFCISLLYFVFCIRLLYFVFCIRLLYFVFYISLAMLPRCNDISPPW